MREKVSAEKTVQDIRRKTRKRYSAEEKVRIVLEGLRGEDSVRRQNKLHSLVDWLRNTFARNWARRALRSGRR